MGADPAETQRPGSSLEDHGLVSAGTGEENMLSFFRTHMESILQPFAENVEELHKTVVTLQKSVCALQEKTLKDTDRLDDQHQRMDVFHTRQEQLIERAEATRRMLEGTIHEHGKVDKAKSARIDKIDASLSQSIKAIEELQKELAEASGKVDRLQEVSKSSRNDLFDLNNKIGQVASDLGKTDEAHASTVDAVRRNKLTFNNHVKESKELEQEQRYLRAKFISLNDECTDKVKTLKEKCAETQSGLLQHKKDTENSHEAINKLLSDGKDLHEEVRREAQAHLKKLDTEIQHQNARMEENDKEYRNLFRSVDQRHSSDLQSVRADINSLDDLTRNLPSQVAALEHLTGVTAGKGRSRVEILEEESELAFKRNLRLEKVLKLDPMTKENMDDKPRVSLHQGILLTEDQMQQFQDQFNLYDLDGSGAVNAQEVGDILAGLGFEVKKNVIDLVMNEIDADRSGEINFDEFCKLMTKMLGPDGNLDVEGYMKNLSEVAVREAKQNEIVELFPGVQADIKRQQDRLLAEQGKLNGTNEALNDLNSNHAKLREEVERLRKGLELNDGYWKGMQRGLKDTKKTVHADGDNQMLPSATRLRNALPPLASLASPLK